MIQKERKMVREKESEQDRTHVKEEKNTGWKRDGKKKKSKGRKIKSEPARKTERRAREKERDINTISLPFE